jgi:hypothetical protein
MIHDDDGASCVGLTLFTSAWSRAYAPGSLADDLCMTVALFERQDGIELEPVFVPTLALVGELLVEMQPPAVIIRSASGEDITLIQALVERAAANKAPH